MPAVRWSGGRRRAGKRLSRARRLPVNARAACSGNTIGKVVTPRIILLLVLYIVVRKAACKQPPRVATGRTSANPRFVHFELQIAKLSQPLRRSIILSQHQQRAWTGDQTSYWGRSSNHVTTGVCEAACAKTPKAVMESCWELPYEWTSTRCLAPLICVESVAPHGLALLDATTRSAT